ncbi:EamA family transporter [Sphingobacterium sp. Mn56C]|uniref:EamA family transporter n=1 Tax=Sphingobacterium sp. Mn56C TaxID=3395261 RepID=UPI003BC5B333
MKRFQGALAVFLGAASFGVLSTFVKKAYGLGYSLGEVTGIQALMGMLFLWVLYLVYGKRLNTEGKYLKITPKWKIILSGFSTGMVSILYYKCVALVPASIAIVLLMQFIWISAVINYIFFKQKPSLKQSIGIICILGATLLATGLFEASFSRVSLIGIGYGLLAALAYAVFILVNGKVGNDYPPVHKSALMVTGACIFVFMALQPIALLDGSLGTDIYTYGLVLSLFGTVLPPLLYAYGMPTVGVSLGSILSAVELPVAVSMSYFVLQEEVSLLRWLGVALILLFVAWINITKSSKI